MFATGFSSRLLSNVNQSFTPFPRQFRGLEEKPIVLFFPLFTLDCPPPPHHYLKTHTKYPHDGYPWIWEWNIFEKEKNKEKKNREKGFKRISWGSSYLNWKKTPKTSCEHYWIISFFYAFIPHRYYGGVQPTHFPIFFFIVFGWNRPRKLKWFNNFFQYSHALKCFSEFYNILR